MESGAKWRGVVPFCPPSANIYLRSHWTEQSRLKKVWYLEIYAAFKEGFPTKAKGKRKVRVEVTSTRTRDHSNLWTPVDKLILDNLTKIGWIVDDCPEYIEIEVLGKKGVPETVIEIWEEKA